MNRTGQIWRLHETPPSEIVLVTDSRKLGTGTWEHQVVYLATSGNYRSSGELQTWVEYAMEWENSSDMKRII